MHFVIIVKTCERAKERVVAREARLSVHECVFRLKMLFLDLDLDRDFSVPDVSSLYFALWILGSWLVVGSTNIE